MRTDERAPGAVDVIKAAAWGVTLFAFGAIGEAARAVRRRLPTSRGRRTGRGKIVEAEARSFSPPASAWVWIQIEGSDKPEAVILHGPIAADFVFRLRAATRRDGVYEGIGNSVVEFEGTDLRPGDLSGVLCGKAVLLREVVPAKVERAAIVSPAPAGV